MNTVPHHNRHLGLNSKANLADRRLFLKVTRLYKRREYPTGTRSRPTQEGKDKILR